MLQGFLLIAFLMLPPHGDLDIRIAEKTAEISSKPNNLVLYMQRGELHAQHEQPDSALLDYQYAIGNGFDSSTVFVLMAEAQLALGKLDDGLKSAERFLKMESGHLKGIHVRAQLYEAQGQFDDAITDFELVLKNAESPRPQDFVALSSLYLKRDSTDHSHAIEVLYRGIAKLGNIISLEMPLYEMEKDRGNFDAAHAVLDRMMTPLSRKERLLVEKAELFFEQGKTLKAAEILVEAENAIAALPIRFQNIGAMVKLKERIHQLKQQL
jgi:tetratricopeptide (TPR) repeat protein